MGCESITKYVCLKCDTFACNRSLKCPVTPSEDYPGWKKCTKVALLFKYDWEEHATDYQLQDLSEEKGKAVAGISDVELVIHCASRGFHDYRKIWSPKFEQKVNIKRDKINLFDPHAMGLYCQMKESLTLVGHLPREISRLCKYFLEYNSEPDATVRSEKFRRSPLPQGYLEIPIKFLVGKGKASLEIFRKMKGFVLHNYFEP